jgi:PIN domain nuclease of toxin-antitoxin system
MIRVLFDTHAFLWWDSEPEKLSAEARSICLAPDTILLLSVVSLWEILIKIQIGKMSLRCPIRQIVDEQVRSNGVTILPVSANHVFAVETLPLLHRDPFDRLLIAQAVVEEAFLVSADETVRGYPVKSIW